MASDGEISCTTDPNFAVIYSFLKVFGKLYGLEIPTITKLQELLENTQEVLEPLKELHLRLLRRALKSVQSNRWERCLIKFCHQHGHHQEAWEMERFSYKKASTQVKLKVLKILLEYQFTCHPKFKSAVNAISCKELRPEPIGRDHSGCVYWLQVDHDANLCLYREDQDEETWHLIARNREELARVISQLKNGEEICPSEVPNANEDSNSAEVPPQLEPKKAQADEENEEEFLSPESESEQEEDKNAKPQELKEPEQSTNETNQKDTPGETDTETLENKEAIEKASSPDRDKASPARSPVKSPAREKSPSLPDQNEETKEKESPKEDPQSPKTEPASPKIETPVSADDEVPKVEESVTSDSKIEKSDDTPPSPKETEDQVKEEEKEEVGEAIEEPVMVITGEGNGADCEGSYIIGEEISEPVMFFYGEGSGFDNDTGNTEAIARENEAEKSGEENGNEECVNGENHELTSSRTKTVKSVKLKTKLPTVTKRSLKKQSTDNSEVLKPDTKKPCVRNDVSDSSNSNSKSVERELKREGSVNDKTTDSESPTKNNVKKGRSKVKKKPEVVRKMKLKEQKEVVNSVAETDNGHDSKTSIIEKRKSSLSSEDVDDADAENEKEKSPDKELKVEDALPPKKLRLETTPESDVVSHSKETVDEDVNNGNKNELESSTPQRKKIKASKGKFKRKSVQNKTNNVSKNAEDNPDEEKVDDKGGKNKSLKRTLLDATLSDKNKSESQSESEDDEPVTSGKRQKIRPKKIIKSSRKKVEAKLQEKHSSESEEETLYSIAGKKTPKKLLKRKPKSKEKKDKSKQEKEQEKSESEEDIAPVRQSRRIAQLKIKEEAERRHLEEVALREMKKIHKKKANDDEEEDWKASGKSSSESDTRVRKKSKAKWRASDSTGPEPDSESDEPLFEHVEPDLEFTKSDHEFSPESDLESGEPVEPLKRARTLQEEKDDGFCKRCGSGEQPEWILLCDKCDAGYHASCLKPVLFIVPEGDWFCPPCNHEMLITSLESELVKYDELFAAVQAERERKRLEEPQKETESEDSKEEKEDKVDGSDAEGSSSWSSSSSEDGAVYRLRARKQLPVSLRAQEYDRLISSAIKEEYVEPTTSAGNQGRGKDISTIIEAAEEEKLKAEREAIEQGKPVEKKVKKKQRRKPRKLNSLEVPSEDDDDTDEDFKDTGMESSSEDISSSAEKDSTAGSGSSDDLPIRRACRPDKKDRPKLAESSPEVKKKKKGVFAESSSESGDNKEWAKKSKSKKSSSKKQNRSTSKKPRKKGGLTQYDEHGNVIRARVTYGGLSNDDENDWSPKHRTRQRRMNYTETPNTESEDEMHKSSGKHMPDSSDEFKIDDSDLTSDSDSDRAKRKKAEESEQTTEEKKKAIDDLIKKTAVVPLEKLPEDVTKAKTEELQAHLDAQAAAAAAAAGARPLRGKGSRGGRGSRGPRGGGCGRGGRRSSPGTSDDALAKLVGVKIKDLKADVKPLDAEREKKRQEREAKLAEKEAKRQERLQKKEEKEKMKEQKAKDREEKKLAKLAMQENKRLKKEKPEFGMNMNMGMGMGPGGPGAPGSSPMVYNMSARPPGDIMRYPGPRPEYDPRYPQGAPPRLQVRAELRGVLTGEDRLAHRGDRSAAMREGTLSVAGSPQPFKPITEEPSIITRMPHMINQQYRGPMMYGNSGGFARDASGNMYRPQYPPHYYTHLRALPPYAQQQGPYPQHGPSGSMHGPGGPPHGPPHGPGGPPHGPSGPPHGPGGPPHGSPHGPGGLPHGPPHGPSGPPHGPPGGPSHGSSGPHHGPNASPHGPGMPQHGPGASPHSLGAPPHGPGASPLGPMSHRPGSGGPPHAPPGPASSSPHGPPMSHGPPGGPPNNTPHGPAGAPHPLNMPRHAAPPGYGNAMPRGFHPAGVPRAPAPGLPSTSSRPPTPRSPSGPNAPGPSSSPPVRIKAEVKTEPEYRSPPASPSNRPTSPEPPRNHPKIKITENKRPRYPLGPYAPSYGNYAPELMELQARLQAPSPLQRMHHMYANEYLPRGPPGYPHYQPPMHPPGPHNPQSGPMQHPGSHPLGPPPHRLNPHSTSPHRPSHPGTPQPPGQGPAHHPGPQSSPHGPHPGPAHHPGPQSSPHGPHSGPVHQPGPHQGAAHHPGPQSSPHGPHSGPVHHPGPQSSPHQLQPSPHQPGPPGPGHHPGPHQGPPYHPGAPHRPGSHPSAAQQLSHPGLPNQPEGHHAPHPGSLPPGFHPSAAHAGGPHQPHQSAAHPGGPHQPHPSAAHPGVPHQPHSSATHPLGPHQPHPSAAHPGGPHSGPYPSAAHHLGPLHGPHPPGLHGASHPPGPYPGAPPRPYPGLPQPGRMAAEHPESASHVPREEQQRQTNQAERSEENKPQPDVAKTDPKLGSASPESQPHTPTNANLPGPQSDEQRGPHPEGAQPAALPLRTIPDDENKSEPHLRAPHSTGPHPGSSQQPKTVSDAESKPGPYLGASHPAGPHPGVSHPPRTVPDAEQKPGPYLGTPHPTGPHPRASHPVESHLPHQVGPHQHRPHPGLPHPAGPYSAHPPVSHPSAVYQPGPHSGLEHPGLQATSPQQPPPNVPGPSQPAPNSTSPHLPGPNQGLNIHGMHPAVTQAGLPPVASQDVPQQAAPLQLSQPPVTHPGPQMATQPGPQVTQPLQAMKLSPVREPPAVSPEPKSDSAKSPADLGDNVNKDDETKVRIKEEATEGTPGPTGVFGGLVSYFSSQHEDDIDT